MEHNVLIDELKPIVSDGAYARSSAGQNRISQVVMNYLDANFSENQLENSNINVNIIYGGTRINSLNSQAQSQVQYQNQRGPQLSSRKNLVCPVRR